MKKAEEGQQGYQKMETHRSAWAQPWQIPQLGSFETPDLGDIKA